MNKKQANIIFNKYNPQDAVERCPSGRASVRKQLNTYARAAVNLYGIISIKDFVEIFNSQNTEQTNEEEVFVLLLPGIINKNKSANGAEYCFYKKCIIHYWAMEDYNFGDFWLREQQNKKSYIPEKTEFLKYENENHEDKVQKKHWDKVFDFLFTECYKPEIVGLFNELKDCSQISGQFGLDEIQKNYDFSLDTKEQIQTFMNLLANAHNNTRMWINKGHSPEELFNNGKNLYEENKKESL